MSLFFDSFWRAVMYCLLPRVIGMSILPLVLTVSLSGFLGYLYWNDAVLQVQQWLEMSSWLSVVWRWLEGVGFAQLKTVVAPLLVIFSVTPLVVVVCLLAVSFFMTPTLTRMVMERRFPGMQRKHGGSVLKSVGWTVLSVMLALGAFLLTLPMWLVPPLAMLLPALIWGWLTYRVMAFDVLAEFASPEERHTLMARHRVRLLMMGVITGLMGAAPSLVWASGALFAAAFVILVPVAIWIYTLVFAFSSLWFAHYALAGLHALRLEPAHATVDEVLPAAPVPLHASARLGIDPGGVTDVDPRRET
jgi:Etoposide-induced protein 2.4 (EI24)